MTNPDIQAATEWSNVLIWEAVARGWCSPANAGKVMDPILAEAIAVEVRDAVKPILARISQDTKTIEQQAAQIERYEEALRVVCAEVAPGPSYELDDDGQVTTDGTLWYGSDSHKRIHHIVVAALQHDGTVE